MSVPGYTPGHSSYCQVEVLAGNTVMYRQLSFVKYVEPESKKWQFRADWCAIAGLGICLFVVAINLSNACTNVHFPSTLSSTLLVLQSLMLCLQFYCIAKLFLAFRREFRDSKGPSYHIVAGPTYTVPLPANCDLGSDNSVEVHISGQTEKVSFSE